MEAVTPHAPRARAYPGVGQALLLLLLAMAVGAIVQLALLLPGIGLDPRHPGAQALASLVALGVVVAFGRERAGVPWREIVPLRPVPAGLLAAMALTILGLGILLSEADNVLRSVLPPPEWLQRMFAELAGGRRSLWGSVALLVVVAPLTEEVLFRGLILRGFALRYSTRRAIWLSALLFAGFHLNPWQFIGALTAGVVFAWWVIRTGSLIPVLVCHALNNAMPVVVAQSGARIPGYAGVPAGAVEFHPWWLDGIGLVVAAGGLWMVARALRRVPSPSLPAPDRL